MVPGGWNERLTWEILFFLKSRGKVKKKSVLEKERGALCSTLGRALGGCKNVKEITVWCAFINFKLKKMKLSPLQYVWNWNEFDLRKIKESYILTQLLYLQNTHIHIHIYRHLSKLKLIVLWKLIYVTSNF